MQTIPGQVIGEHVVLTGPIKGSVILEDGTTYDVSGEAVEAPLEHHAEIAHLIGLRYAAEGHPGHDADTPFVYTTPEGLKLQAGDGSMDMLYSTGAANQALDALAGGATNLIGFTSCHTAAPAGTGANEYAGVTRQATSWNAASSRAKTNSGALSFTTSGASAVTDFGSWSLVTAGVYGIDMHLTSSVTATTITVAAGALSLSA